ncbi:MAG TPA: hypothetical protein VF079_06070, partial [Sphingomicrobium sp.]
LARAGNDRNRILLTELRSTDWQSLTFVGERHQIRLRVAGPGAEVLTNRLTAGIEDAEFAVPGHIVADILLAGRPQRDGDGAILVELEALTIAE